MSDEITQRAGRHGPFRESHEPRLKASLFVKGAQTGYLAFDCRGGIGGNSWGMDNNDVLGCCGFAAWDHYCMAKLGDPSMAGEAFSPMFKNLADAYFAYGIAQGEPGPHPDEGVDNASMLAWGYKLGLIYGYGEVEDDELDWYASQFKGALIGQILDDDADADFEATPRIPWGSNLSDIPDQNEGHDTYYVLGDGSGNGLLITWGAEQPFVLNYRNRNVTDRWVIFNQDDPFVDHDALQNALIAVHGTVTPETQQKRRESLLGRIEGYVEAEFARLSA